MRDGRIVRDEPVLDRLNATEELDRLKAEEQAVQLTS
jgi:hypothetical protein